MITLWDWITIALFIVLAITYLDRSANTNVTKWHSLAFLPPALLLAGSNYIGNNGYPILAALAIIVAVGLYIGVIRPFPFQ